MALKPNAIVDISKPGAQLQNLTGTWNARVLDGFTPFVVQFEDNGMPMNLNGLQGFIEGNIGEGKYDATTDEIVMEPDAAPVSYTDDGSGNTSLGIVVFRLPPQFFVQTGNFYGYIGLKNSSGVRVTSNNVWFKVIGDAFNMGVGCDAYMNELEKRILQFNQKAQDAIDDIKNNGNQLVNQVKQDYQNQTKNIQESLNSAKDEVRATRAEQGNIRTQLDGIQGQITSQNIVTKKEYDDNTNALNSAINQRLSEMKLTPNAIEDANTLQQNYPNGADGVYITIDTGHKWIYLNGAWKDCGDYQSPGLPDEMLDPLKKQVNENKTLSENNKNGITKNSQDIVSNTNRIEKVEGAGSLKDVYLQDSKGEYIDDQNGNKVLVKKWLVNVDKSLSQSDMPADAQAVGDAIKHLTNFDVTKYDIPVLYLENEQIPSLVDKSVTLKKCVKYNFPLYGVSGTLKKFKVQGASSVSWPKKNFNLTFDNPFAVFGAYGKQKKYTIKSNYNDYSQSMNVVSAKLWGNLRKEEIKANDTLKSVDDYIVDDKGNRILFEGNPQLALGGNSGAIDGMPIALVINSQYWGLYSINVSKDAGMAKMPEKENYAIISADWEPQGALKAETTLEDGNLEVEFCGTKDITWVKNSINNLIRAVMASYKTKDEFLSSVSSFIDIENAMDYYIFVVLISDTDAFFRNYLLQTFDGTKWYFAPYDLDQAYGLKAGFSGMMLPNALPDANASYDTIRTIGTSFESVANQNRLFHQLWKLCKDDVLARVEELLNGPLSSFKVEQMFQDYAQKISIGLKNQELVRWPTTPDTATNDIYRIGRWYTQKANTIQNHYLKNN